MRVQVLKIATHADGDDLVTFGTVCGPAVGRWKGAPRRPEVGVSYYAEWDIDLVGERGRNIGPSSREVGFEVCDGATRVVARVEHIGDDGLVCLRLAEDWVVMLETVGSFSVGEVVEITVPAPSFSVTPFDL
jgi:hypothetical protein